MTIQEYMYRKFREAGMNTIGACATLGQIQYESGFKPNNAEDSKGIPDDTYTHKVDSGARTRQQFMNDCIGYGYAQWTYAPRKGWMYDYHRARNKSIGDSDTQISFLLWEMKSHYPNQWKMVTSSNDLKSCTWELLDKWENPDEKTNNMQVRYAAAQNFYKRFSAIEVEKPPKQKTADDAIATVVNLAKSEVGYHEKASNSNLDDKTTNSGSGNWTKYARDLAAISNFYNGDKNGFAWCDVFVDWLFVKAFGAELGRQMVCQPYNSAGAGCLYSAQYYKQAGRWYSQPNVGDQVFFSYAPGEYSHTGLVESVQNGTITTIEGNTSDQVGRRTYRIGDAGIIGYGRPKWDLIANTDPDAVIIFDGPTAPVARILRYGVRGEDVRALQDDLIKLGYSVGHYGADGDFGSNTREAVVLFQTEHNLSLIDGEVGPDTRKALDDALKALEEPKKPEPTKEDDSIPRSKLQIRELHTDMEGHDVKLAQAALLCWGYTTLTTGIFGKEMHDKICDFQSKKGLKPTGTIDTATWKALLKI